MTPDALRKAAEQGHADAQLQLGIACLTGDGLPAQDVAQGREWLGRAADNGSVDAARFLGLILLRGMDVVPDLDRGQALLTQAATAGDIEAIFPDISVMHTPNGDYKYRVDLSREDVVKVVAESVRNIDYTNFKDSI